MRSIPVISVKGGTGKSTVCARTALALRDLGLKLGLLDIDLTGATLPSALGMAEPFPHVGLDTERQKMFPIKYDGLEVFSLAFRFGKAALMWKGGEQKIKAFGQEFDFTGTGRYQLVSQMLSNVEFSPLDYLLIDCPPTTGDEALSLWEHLKEVWGLLLVCQPTNLSLQDIERALNMIEVKHLPLLGMVGSMMETICPSCGQHFSPFLDGGVDLPAFCRQRGIPFIASIPFVPDAQILNGVFNRLAQDIHGCAGLSPLKPVEIWQRSFKDKLVEATTKGIVRAVFSRGV